MPPKSRPTRSPCTDIEAPPMSEVNTSTQVFTYLDETMRSVSYSHKRSSDLKPWLLYGPPDSPAFLAESELKNLHGLDSHAGLASHSLAFNLFTYVVHIDVMASVPVQYLDESTDQLCQRCKTKPAVLVSRKEHFCTSCFIFFMRGKQRKTMQDDRYKVKYGAVAEKWGQQKVLLPLSFGVSSLVLLDMIACLLKEQLETHKGNCAFDLVVVHLLEEDQSKRPDFEDLAKKYHPVAIKYVEHGLNKYSAADFKSIAVSPTFDVVGSEMQADDITNLLHNAASRSSMADLKSIVYGDIFRRVACEEGCQTLLFGHSMTRLANEVLSLTVKGRGSVIHEAIADKSVTYGKNNIQIIFPLRDILFAEVSAVMQLSEGLSQYHVQQQKPASRLIKNMTVEDLTTEYFENLDATGYASTASTVVKTAEKLGGPTDSHKSMCQICSTKIHHDPKQWLSNITANTAAPLVTDKERAYVELAQATQPKSMDGMPLSVCYGCTVTLAGAGGGFVWPVHSTKQEILDEFVLTDEE